MDFNLYQLALINEIKDGEIYDLTSFIKKNMGVSNYEIDLNDYYQIFTITRWNKLFIEKVEEAYYYSFNLFSLLEFLKNQKLIYFIETEDKYEIGFDSNIINDKTKIQLNLLNKLFNRKNLIFYPSEELNSFIERNYNTLAESKIYEEDKDRKKSLKWTKIIAITSIILSLSTGIINFITYKTDRVVTIQNQKDTVKVLLLDTLKENK